MKQNKKTTASKGNKSISKVATKVAYELEDGENQHQQYPDTFWIPSRAERENILPGTNVKITFKIYVGDEECFERMWVEVVNKQADHYVGYLNNYPASNTEMRPGDEIVFRPEHVIQIMLPKEVPTLAQKLTEEHLATALQLNNTIEVI
jgi:uncharacterized protein YegJ (DUF2314 family)